MAADSDYIKLISKALALVNKDQVLQEELCSVTRVDLRLKLLDGSLREKGLDISDKAQKWRRNSQLCPDCDASKRWRSKGNEHYKCKELEQALACYTNALNFIPLNHEETSSEMALCLGNKSAALFELKDYYGALGNASLALACKGVNADKKERLVERCNKCQQSCQQKERSYKKELPISDGETVRIKFDKKLGRHGVAARDISFGQIIFVDKPIAAVPLTCKSDLDHFQNNGNSVEGDKTCNYCLKSQSGCFESPFIGNESLFCSRGCLETAFKTYHSFESKLDFSKMLLGNDRNKTDSPSRRMHLAMRLVLQQPLTYFQEMYNQREKTADVDDLVDASYGSNISISEIDPEKCLQSLLTHEKDRSHNEKLRFSINALVLLHSLAAMEYISKELDDSAYFIGSFLYKYLAVLTMNGHAVMTKPSGININQCATSNALSIPQDVVGSALYPTLPLLNHSCKPNTIRFNRGFHVVLMAIEDIPKGSEVSDSYGLVHYITNEKEERQTVLKTRFNFECQCIACVQNFPVFAGLPRKLPKNAFTIYANIAEKLETEMTQQNYVSAFKNCGSVYHFLKKIGLKPPHTAYARLTYQLQKIALELFAA